MITEADARTFAEAAFPDAPEKLANRLGIDVRSSPLSDLRIGFRGFVVLIAGL